MPQAIYTPFSEDEVLKDADSGINELVEKVIQIFLLSYFVSYL
jgi:hypothetical protein